MKGITNFQVNTESEWCFLQEHGNMALARILHKEMCFDIGNCVESSSIRLLRINVLFM